MDPLTLLVVLLVLGSVGLWFLGKILKGIGLVIVGIIMLLIIGTILSGLQLPHP